MSQPSVSQLGPGGNAVLRPLDGEPLVIGIVNNMPDTALRATERHFRELLDAAACGQPIHLRLFSAPQVRRGEACHAYLSLAYESIDQLWDGQLDGLIVTGAEPRALALEDEPYWPTLARLTDWAEGRTLSTVWSCLAAQAAVLRANGIVRRPFGWKLSGVYASAKAAEHPITAGLLPHWRSPQTRYNDLPEAELVLSGYRILSRLPDAGADMFVREGRSLFVFMQGHPEYDPRALFREYRRDIGRFLTGERDHYPDPMHGYFDKSAEAALDTLRKEALRTRDPALLERLPELLAGWLPPYDWRGPVIQMYANWLLYLTQRKSGDVAAMQLHSVVGDLWRGLFGRGNPSRPHHAAPGRRAAGRSAVSADSAANAPRRRPDAQPGRSP